MAETSDLGAARGRIRETAKWLSVSVGAVAGVLVAGLQLSSIGSLALWSGRFWCAIVGASLAVAGAGFVLSRTIDTMAAPALALHELTSKKPPEGVGPALADRALRGDHDDVSALQEAYMAAISARDQAFRNHYGKPDDRALGTAADVADAQAVVLSETVGSLLDVASYQALAHRWRAARRAVIGGAALAAVGIGAFAWATNPPEGAAGTAVEPAVLTEPQPGTLRLSSAGQEALADALGAACLADGPLEALVLGTTGAGPDVLVESEGCDPVRFVLVPAWGTVG